MTNLKGIELKKLFEEEFGVLSTRKLSLYIVLGLLGDFDSFELVQSLLSDLNQFKAAGLDLYVLAIGNSTSKEYFCNYTDLPLDAIRVVKSNTIHQKLGLDHGLNLPISPLLNLLLMCMGINSKGTLKEVLRGYIGDRDGRQIFTHNQKLSFFNKISLNTGLFKILGGEGFLRPFELASLRLMNMTEIISNWKIYMTNELFLTQRSGVFLLDAKENLVYSYKSKGLLDFAEDKSNPLEFIYNRL